ncbi:MAG TPA: YbdD/YjiX family protein [Pseudomonadales bacterium]|nr:YbdD/YjiX family protein [Pseudomonadales bacterium]
MSKKRTYSAVSNRYFAAGKSVLLRAVQTARLMVGVGDYQQYLEHMQSHHPDETAMSDIEYFRYCQDSRYPGKDGSLKRCPC